MVICQFDVQRINNEFVLQPVKPYFRKGSAMPAFPVGVTFQAVIAAIAHWRMVVILRFVKLWR